MLYTPFQITVQIISSILIGGSTFFRSVSRKHMLLASWLSLLGGLMFMFYSVITTQWAIIPLNLWTAGLGLKAIFTWSKNKKRKK